MVYIPGTIINTQKYIGHHLCHYTQTHTSSPTPQPPWEDSPSKYPLAGLGTAVAKIHPPLLLSSIQEKILLI